MEGLKSLLASRDGPRVVAMETNLQEAAEAVRELCPSILVVAKDFGINEVVEWLRLLRAENAPIASVVWGFPMSEPEALRYLQAGASGIIRKTASLDDLWACIHAVSSGGNWMESQILRDPARPVRIAHSLLTARESQVMDLVARGYKNKEIGSALGITTGTVKIHLKHIFEKTGIHGRYGLALSGLHKSQLTEALS
jgi:DNA-binding NarL/FixJ family response regulator